MNNSKIWGRNSKTKYKPQKNQISILDLGRELMDLEPSYKQNSIHLQKSQIRLGEEERVFPSVKLPIKGQGIVQVKIEKKSETLITENSSICIELSDPDSRKSLSLTIKNNEVLFGRPSPTQPNETEFIKGFSGKSLDHKCLSYWLSLDQFNRQLRFGKGELRLETNICQCGLFEEELSWIQNIQDVICYNQPSGLVSKLNVHRDPIVFQTPLFTIPREKLTMDILADPKRRLAVIDDLNPDCAYLYNKIQHLTLRDPKFPEFSQSIQNSLDHEGSWCYNAIKKKQQKQLEDSGDPRSTYLRITFGLNEGNSPGAPFVLEIWPAKHYSPIHRHGGANAIIKVLHGEVVVELYAYLDGTGELKPHTSVPLRQGDITWITPCQNQIHKLINRTDEMCITIQSYRFSEKDDDHYRYFEAYKPEKKKVIEIDPTSDADYPEFKKKIKMEYHQKNIDEMSKFNLQDAPTLRKKDQHQAQAQPQIELEENRPLKNFHVYQSSEMTYNNNSHKIDKKRILQLLEADNLSDLDAAIPEFHKELKKMISDRASGHIEEEEEKKKEEKKDESHKKM